MKKFEEQKHFLSLMARPKDYVFIDISSLDIANGCGPQDLSEIDTFTMYFTIAEIRESIKRSNIVSEAYLNGSLVIADNQKHNPIQVIDKEFYDNFQIDIYLKEKMEDKEAKNNLLNKFRSVSEDSSLHQDFANAIKSNDVNKAQEVIFSLPYLQMRKYIVYLITMRNLEKTKEHDPELKRDKAA